MTQPSELRRPLFGPWRSGPSVSRDYSYQLSRAPKRQAPSSPSSRSSFFSLRSSSHPPCGSGVYQASIEGRTVRPLAGWTCAILPAISEGQWRCSHAAGNASVPVCESRIKTVKASTDYLDAPAERRKCAIALTRQASDHLPMSSSASEQAPRSSLAQRRKTALGELNESATL